MQYAAVMLCADGGVLRHEQTQEVANILIGDFESMDDAVNQACAELNCKHLRNGVISKGESKPGFMLVTTQDLESV